MCGVVINIIEYIYEVLEGNVGIRDFLNRIRS